MKRKFLITVLSLLTVATCAFGLAACGGEEEETYDQLTFTLAPNESHYVVYGAANASGSVEIPATYKNVPVTEIGNGAFKDCNNLTAITIPDSITEIDSEAFKGCTSLTDIQLNKVAEIGAEAFRGCWSLSKVTFTDTLKISGRDAFLDCESLKGVYVSDLAKWCSVKFDSRTANPLNYAGSIYVIRSRVNDLTIPASVKTIPAYTFASCKFNSITVPESVTEINKDAFVGGDATTINAPTHVLKALRYRNTVNLNINGGEVIPELFSPPKVEVLTIGSSVKKIESYTFSYLYNLKEVHVESLDSWCAIDFGVNSNPLKYASKFFVKDTYVKNLVIPDTVTEIKTRAFSEFTGFESVNTGNGVKTIGEYAFSSCSEGYHIGIESVTIGNSVTTIGKGAFTNCLLLKTLKLGNKVKTIGDYAFEKCEYLANVNIPDSVTAIGMYAFRDCERLKSVTIPDSVRTLEDSVFLSCEALESISIGNGVTEIGGWLCSSCPKLTTAVIGSAVKVIDYEAFGRDKLQKVYYKGTQQQWDKIDILVEDGFNTSNSYLIETVPKYFYSETQPEDEGNYWHYVDGKVTEW